MIEIRLEIEPKNKTPLEVENLLVEALENLVKNQDIEHYVLSLPSTGHTVATLLYEGVFKEAFEAIHAGGKEVK